MTTPVEPQLHYIAYDDFLADVRKVALKIDSEAWKPDFVIGIGRGGLVPAVYISHQLDLPMLSIDHSSKVHDFADELLAKVATKSAAGIRLLFVDDINDSGGTIVYIRQLLADNGCDPANLRFAVIINNSRSKAHVEYWTQTIDRAEDKRWFVFPWEAVASGGAIVAEAISVPERLA
ncbi:MAG: phosphoribosyltransferase domain-containing protein [Sphingomonadaceae bacterium]|nr:phosphoribosyltransferase domain-containing protein [Sphingomonadaceae bacterium]